MASAEGATGIEGVMQDQSNAHGRLHGVSRRRVLHGAAWATPAILIATGSPPAAASTGTAGTMVWNPAGVDYYGKTIQVQFALRHSGPYYPVAAPISGLSVTVSIPTNQATGTYAPSSQLNGWVSTNLGVVGGSHQWQFTWSGPISVANGGTSATLAAMLYFEAKNAGSVTVTFHAQGTSAGQSVTLDQTITRAST